MHPIPDCCVRAAELRRDGTTIHSDVEISYVDAILGTTTKVHPSAGYKVSVSSECTSTPHIWPH